MSFSKISSSLLLAGSLASIGSTVSASTDSLVPRPAAGFFNATYFQPADIKESEDIEFTQQDTHFKMPLGKIGEVEQSLVAFGFNLRQRTLDFDNPSGADSNQTLYDISLPITYVKKADKETNYIFNLAPGFKSSLEYVDEEDLAVNAVGQIMKNHGEHSYAYGLVYTHAFGKGKFVPLASYTYQPNAQWQMTAGFPVSYVSYAPSWGQNYFAKLTPNGGSWHVYGDEKEDQFDIVQVGYRLGAGGQWQIKGPFWFELETGLQFAQKLDLEDDAGNKIDAEFEDTGYIQLGINLNFGGPNQK